MSDELNEVPGDLFDGIEEPKGDIGDNESDSILQFTPEDRPRGILSKTDREYLSGLKEYAQPQTDANRRQDIRERVANGLWDFLLLFLFLGREEREKLFDELGDDTTEEAITWMTAFAYLALDQDRPRFEECLERGILLAENRNNLFRSAGRATNADVSIKIEYNPNPEKLYRQFEEGKDLTDAEIGVLVRNGMLESGDFEELNDDTPDFPGVYVGSRPKSGDESNSTE